MGLANWLTVLRILLVPVFVTLLVYRQPGLAALVFAAAAITDLLDGWVARRQGMQSRLGAFLDPLADKILLTASFVTLTWLKVLPFWITAVVLSRDAFLALGTLLIHMVGARIYPRPTWAGKAATFFQIVTVFLGVFGPLRGHASRADDAPVDRRGIHARLRPAVPRAGHALPQRRPGRRARGDA